MTAPALLQDAPRASGKAVVTRDPADDIDTPFTLAHFRQWASGLILDTDEPWHLEPFQEAFVEDLFAGYREAWLIVPEGNGKTTMLAGLGLYHCEFRPFAQVPIAAASREQAEIMYRQAEGFVLRSPRLHEHTHSEIQAAKGKQKTQMPRFQCLEGYRRINHVGGGRIQVFAADDRTGDGIIPTLGIIDEPHRQRDLSLYRTWAGKLLKRQGQLVAISTRGEPGSDFELTLERIRRTADEVEHDGAYTRAVSRRIVLQEWALPESQDPEDIGAVKAANPFSGITTEMLTEKLAAPTMTSHHWLRFVCNRPTQDVDMWLGPDGPALWESLLDPYQFVDGAPTWAGLDMARTRDTTAVVTIQQRPDGRYHAVCRVFMGSAEQPIDPADVSQYVRELHRRYDLKAVGYDPYQFDMPAGYLRDEGITMDETPQSVERMTIAIGSVYGALNRREITHDEDDEFTLQVMNAVPRFNERGFMLSKGRSRGHIDAAVALALAYDRVTGAKDPEPEVEPFFLVSRR